MSSSTTSNMISDTDQVVIEGDGGVRTLTLNRPRQLNAISFPMVSQLLKSFMEYEDDPNVLMVILKGKGRAFCAGGDVAAVVRDVTDGHFSLGVEFFRREYTLNCIMGTYRKPQVSILDGIVMGGGAGASMHGRFRVATENTVFAMPETSLGLFPDVGASYFLSRLPGFFGEYVGLTGARLDGAELLACGLATHYVPSMRLPSLEAALHEVDKSDPLVIDAVLKKFSEKATLKQNSPYHRLDIIDKCFSRRTVEEILAALEVEVLGESDVLLSSTILSLKKASPLSLKITLRAIREGRLQSFDQCLINEFRIVCHILRKERSADFFEGCRAIIVDKDRNPKWQPSTLESVSEEIVDCYFKEADGKLCRDLVFPRRPLTTFFDRSRL